MANEIFDPPAPQPEQSAQQPQKLDNFSKELGFEIPIETVSLPSNGLVYPLDHPLANVETVDIKCMTSKEEDILTSRALMKSGTIITKLLQSCMINKSIDTEDMLVGDRNAILIALRITGYGPQYTVKVTCPECDEQFENEFSLNGLPIKRLAVKPDAPNINEFTFQLPTSKLFVKFRLLTGKLEQDFNQVIDKKKKLGSQVDNLVSTRLFFSIIAVKLGDGTIVTERSRIQTIVQNMRAGDSFALRKYMEDIQPGVEMKQKAVCTHCGAESEVDVPLTTTFFWPNGSK